MSDSALLLLAVLGPLTPIALAFAVVWCVFPPAFKLERNGEE